MTSELKAVIATKESEKRKHGGKLSDQRGFYLKNFSLAECKGLHSKCALRVNLRLFQNA